MYNGLEYVIQYSQLQGHWSKVKVDISTLRWNTTRSFFKQKKLIDWVQDISAVSMTDKGQKIGQGDLLLVHNAPLSQDVSIDQAPR